MAKEKMNRGCWMSWILDVGFLGCWILDPAYGGAGYWIFEINISKK